MSDLGRWKVTEEAWSTVESGSTWKVWKRRVSATCPWCWVRHDVETVTTLPDLMKDEKEEIDRELIRVAARMRETLAERCREAGCKCENEHPGEQLLTTARNEVAELKVKLRKAEWELSIFRGDDLAGNGWVPLQVREARRERDELREALKTARAELDVARQERNAAEKKLSAFENPSDGRMYMESQWHSKRTKLEAELAEVREALRDVKAWVDAEVGFALPSAIEAVLAKGGGK